MAARDLDEQALALAGRHYDRLVLAGQQGLALNPIVNVTAPAQALVLWASPARVLEGYEVSKTDSETAFDNCEFERIGFSRDALHAGLWVLRGVRYEPCEPRPAGGGGWKEAGSTSHLFASYDPVGRRWDVVRLKEPARAPRGSWASQWRPKAHELTDAERAVIARVAQETDMLLDVAVTLQDAPLARDALERALMQRAQRSADPDDARRIGAIFRPYEYLPLPVASQFRISALGTDLAGPLYRALAGQAPHDSTAIMATDTVTDATLCPPYDPVTLRLSRDSGRLPGAPRPQARRAAPRRRPHPPRPPAGPALS